MAGALGFAEHRLAALRGASPAHDALLREVVALIAYQQPEQVRGRVSVLSTLLALRWLPEWVTCSVM